MPQIRSSKLTTNEVAVFDTESGEMVILPVGSSDRWNAVEDTLEAAKKLSDELGGYVVSKKQLKTLLLATDRCVFLT